MGTSVENLGQDINLSVRELGVHGFWIISGSNKQYFEVILESGASFMKDQLDKDDTYPDVTSYSIHLETVVNNLLLLYRVKINVLNIKDILLLLPV